ncbi:unnamed protein product [Phaedon cochleariae]|uniref:Dynein axonemal assembly factor 1 homolog n=1 Tax=Phaedon cochleariae TaxID=80249 RepID=A0A9P0D8V1_PHACE|nr:unnamed protein product [Phaedon cochleariae]
MWTPNPPEDSLINYLVSNVNSLNSKDEDDTVEEEDTPLLEELRSVSGYWGVHDIDKNPWNDDARPYIKLNNFKDLQFTEEESTGKLTERMVAACLSFLEKSPVIFNFALCKCVLSKKNLVDISVLGNYHYLQYLDVSRNNIKDLKPLGQMPFLQYLNVSENDIEYLLDFKAPFNLYHVDFSKNSVSAIPDLSDFWAISYLNLAYNDIEKITGLGNLTFLTHLDMSHNNLKKVENLTNLRIQNLILNDNLIDQVDIVDMSTLCYIRSVNLSHNRLTSLKFVRKIENVGSLNLSFNNVSDLLEVYYMKGLRYLTRVNLNENPVSDEPHYSTICIRKIMNLRFLDDVEITAEKKIDAWTKSKISYLFPARESRMELFLLQQINRPKIGAHIVPYDQPPPDVIMVVGPPGSRKKKIVRRFLETQKRIFQGVSHTTRPMRHEEEDGLDYYFVTMEVFSDLARKGEFIATSEFNGYSYGIAYDELRKCEDSVVVFYSDIHSALTLKVMGICPKLVLAMPREEETHLKWLKLTYYYDHIMNSKELRIKNSPSSVQNALGGAIDDDNEVVKDFDELFEIGDVSVTSDMMTYGDEEFRSAGQNDDGRHLYRNDRSPTSIKSDQFNLEDSSRRLSNKSTTGILKNKEGMQNGSENVSPSLKEKFGTKRVSFNWLAGMDQPEAAEETASTPSRITHKSISDSCISMQEQAAERNCVAESPLLSVLSSNKLPKSQQGGTVYMSLTERFGQLQMEKLGSFFEQIIHSRKELLELHWENPGLFRAVIFTDDEDDCMKQLKELLKYTVECHNTSKQIFSLDHPSSTDAINSRLKSLKLDETYYVRK